VADVEEDIELLPDGDFVTRADRVDVPVTVTQTEVDGDIEILDEKERIAVVEAVVDTEVDIRGVEVVVPAAVCDSLNAELCDELGQNDPDKELDGEFVVLILVDGDREPDTLLEINTETDPKTVPLIDEVPQTVTLGETNADLVLVILAVYEGDNELVSVVVAHELGEVEENKEFDKNPDFEVTPEVDADVETESIDVIDKELDVLDEYEFD